MTVPIGTILAYGGLVDGNAKGQLQSQGWLVCDGEEYSEDEYPELDNTIGVYYGTPSRPGMFKVPDLRGRFVRGVDAGAGRDPDVESRSGGHETTKLGSVQEDALKDHFHKLYTVEAPEGELRWALNHGEKQGRTDGRHSRRTAGVRGASTSEETHPKNIYVNWIIKARDV